MTAPTGGRWDGLDDPDYQPTQAELEEPVTIDAIPEQVGETLMRTPPKRRSHLAADPPDGTTDPKGTPGIV